MFITVRYGDGQELLFNPKCRINVLLESIKTKCNCDKGVIIDLCDEKGNMKKLFENPESYANEFLSERDSFILIKVEKREGQESYKLTPLINELFTTTAFLDALTQAEKDAGSLKNSIKSNSRQGKKKQIPSKVKVATPTSSQSPRQERDKSNQIKTSKSSNRKV
ncbi:uncharacterized protein CXorf65 homolog [Rhopilema esculentum]|uniref:uncharacterized protein CXorf65 homolog n=1 Tax=Rhopilema esculentum TaxID=499914 RepID=UPI0031E18FAC